MSYFSPEVMIDLQKAFSNTEPHVPHHLEGAAGTMTDAMVPEGQSKEGYHATLAMAGLCKSLSAIATLRREIPEPLRDAISEVLITAGIPDEHVTALCQEKHPNFRETVLHYRELQK
jgi:hypothetical protein